MKRSGLLLCGIAASLLYVAMNIVVPMQWHAYSSTSQTVSELSAIGAPTRSLWIVLAIPYTLLMAAFGWGVRTSAGQNRHLRTSGTLLLVYGLVGLAWPPMHLRDVIAAGGATLTDTLHIAFAAMTVLLMLLSIGFGAAAFGTHFRRYSVATIAILMTFGVLTSLDAPKIDANLPTPWIGLWERINIGAFLLWVVVTAITVLRHQDRPALGPAEERHP